MTRVLKDPQTMNSDEIQKEIIQHFLDSVVVPNAETLAKFSLNRIARTQDEADKDLRHVEQLQLSPREKQLLNDIAKLKFSDKSEPNVTAVNHFIKDFLDWKKDRITPNEFYARLDQISKTGSGQVSPRLMVLGSLLALLLVGALITFIILLTLPVSAPALTTAVSIAIPLTLVGSGLSFWAGREKGLCKVAKSIKTQAEQTFSNPPVLSEQELPAAREMLIEMRATIPRP